MNDLKIFESDEFGQVRTVIIDGEPWFVGKDVAAALGYADTFGALKKHVDNEDKQNCQNDSFETPRGMIIINESGMYALIFGSKLDSAKKFKHWVTSEVLPALWRTGTYSTPEAKQRDLTKDDYIRAASIIAGCRNERMPYVMNLLGQAGFEIPGLEQIGHNKGTDQERPEEATFEEYVEELKVAAWERKGRSMVTCRQFNDFCAGHGISARKFRRWLYQNGYIMATTSGDKINYSVSIWEGETNEVRRCVVFKEI